MARSTMIALIRRTRDLINDNDPDTALQTWTDDQIQDRLDLSRQLVRYSTLRPVPTFAAGGVYTYSEFLASLGDWETDARLYGPDFSDITATFPTFDCLTGRFVSNKPSPGQPLPVYIVGSVYDVYRAAADLLESWAATYSRRASFSADGSSFQLGNVAGAMREQANAYRRKQRPEMARLTRPDANRDQSGWLWAWGTDASADEWG